MGRTRPTYRREHDRIINNLQGSYRRVLHHQGDRDAFDALVEEMHLRRDAAGDYNPRGQGETVAIMLLNALVGVQRELTATKAKVEALEAALEDTTDP